MEWQPIETAPKGNGAILVAGDGIVWMAEWYSDRGRTLVADDRKPYWEEYDNSSWMLVDGYPEWFEVTHWMPLPEPPSIPRPDDAKR